MERARRHPAHRDGRVAVRPGPRELAPLVLAAWLAALAFGCGPAPRPASDAWAKAWAEERASWPGAEELTGPGAQGACERMLVSTRAARGRLLPAPDEVLDRAAEAWIERAGGLAFDCPGAQGDDEAVRAALREMDELAAQIQAALGVEQGDQDPPLSRRLALAVPSSAPSW